jgi:hypothetical protein
MNSVIGKNFNRIKILMVLMEHNLIPEDPEFKLY